MLCVTINEGTAGTSGNLLLLCSMCLPTYQVLADTQTRISRVQLPVLHALRVIGATNTKSRVETQITIKLRLSYLPLGVTKVHLPKHTISKPKFLDQAAPAAVPGHARNARHACMHKYNAGATTEDGGSATGEASRSVT